jgi:hypothetical protein
MEIVNPTVALYNYGGLGSFSSGPRDPSGSGGLCGSRRDADVTLSIRSHVDESFQRGQTVQFQVDSFTELREISYVEGTKTNYRPKLVQTFLVPGKIPPPARLPN